MTEPQVEGPESGEQSEAPEPWAPEGVAKIGKGPSHDGDGERGTSVYDGDGASDERGPARGVDYYESNNTTTAPHHAGTENQRESATRS